MSSSIEKLGLQYDPFDGRLDRNDFFGGAGRDRLVFEVLDRVRERTSKRTRKEVPDRTRENISLDVIMGPGGIGKSRVARRLCECAGNDVKCAVVPVNLFTTEQSLLDQVLEELGLGASSDLEDGREKLREHSAVLSRRDKAIILMIDNAHELELGLRQGLRQNQQKRFEWLLADYGSAIHLVLLGNEQLWHTLQPRLSEKRPAKVVTHELAALNRVETAEYIRLKLSRAGYRCKLPLSSRAGLEVLQKSQGVPGRIDSLTSAMLDTLAVPQAQPRGKSGLRSIFGRPESRYLAFAFASGLLLAVVLAWPEEGWRPLASSAAQDRQTQAISLPVPATAPPSGDRQAAGSASAASSRQNEREASRLSEFEMLLLDSPSGHFAVEALASASEQQVRDFLAASPFGDIQGYYETRSGGGEWYVAVYGIHADWEHAKQTRDLLVARFDGLDPSIRRISQIHSEIARAGKLEEARP